MMLWIDWDLDWTWGAIGGAFAAERQSPCLPNAHRGPRRDVRGMEQGIGLLHPFALWEK